LGGSNFGNGAYKSYLPLFVYERVIDRCVEYVGNGGSKEWRSQPQKPSRKLVKACGGGAKVVQNIKNVHVCKLWDRISREDSRFI